MSADLGSSEELSLDWAETKMDERSHLEAEPKS